MSAPICARVAAQWRAGKCSLLRIARPAVLAALKAMGVLALAAPVHAAAPAFEDSIAQRAQACTLCHGEQGRAAPDGYYPRLAGKPAGYLYNQLLNFRDGRRHYGLMARLLDPLPDAYLQEFAQHFASLSLPYPAPAPATQPAAVLERGQTLVQQGDAARRIPACIQCHGDALTGVAPHIPGLLGLPRDYLNGQLGAWQAGKRRAQAPDCMADIARRMSDEDIAAVSGWLAAQRLPADTRAATALRKTPSLACGSAPATQAGGRP